VRYGCKLRLFHRWKKLENIITLLILLMQNNPALYSKEAPSKPGRLLLSSSARKLNEGDVTVAIFEHCLVESSSKGKSYILFDFDLKFGHVANPPSVFLERENAKQTY